MLNRHASLFTFRACFALALLALSACAGTTPAVEKKVEQKVRAAPPAASSMAAAREAVFESDSLSAEQKKSLKKLFSETSAEQARLRTELGKNQTVLMHMLVDANAKEAEIELLKTRILELEREKSSVFMRTLDQAEAILGRKDLQDERFYRAFLMNPVQPDTLP
ncbi:MAG: hypothetical protein EOP11_05090 [Proteobacteria bacterium]|nr:MAG: hypothetical protein EOP11_05090 [Pseudomonadota bacterium]